MKGSRKVYGWLARDGNAAVGNDSSIRTDSTGS